MWIASIYILHKWVAKVKGRNFTDEGGEDEDSRKRGFYQIMSTQKTISLANITCTYASLKKRGAC